MSCWRILEDRQRASGHIGWRLCLVAYISRLTTRSYHFRIMSKKRWRKNIMRSRHPPQTLPKERQTCHANLADTARQPMDSRIFGGHTCARLEWRSVIGFQPQKGFQCHCFIIKRWPVSSALSWGFGRDNSSIPGFVEGVHGDWP